MGQQLHQGASAVSAMAQAEGLITEAICLLDEATAPAHIAARLDLALHELRQVDRGNDN